MSTKAIAAAGIRQNDPDIHPNILIICSVGYGDATIHIHPLAFVGDLDFGQIGVNADLDGGRRFNNRFFAL